MTVAGHSLTFKPRDVLALIRCRLFFYLKLQQLMKALIVDDSRAMRRLLSHLCNNISCDTIEACDGRAGLKEAKSNLPFDIALLDWDMPEMNGLELLRELRSDQQFTDTKIMMVTSHNSMDDITAAVESGADDFLMKPITEEMFVDKMRLLGFVG